MSPLSTETGCGSPGVLVADEESAIRKLLEMVLTSEGFRVWIARDGQDAVDLLQRHPEEIHLALLDVQMPGRDGLETLRSLKTLRPDLPCCLMTGGSPRYNVRDLWEAGAVKIFQKPFSLSEVIWSLRRLAGFPDRRRQIRVLVPQTGAILGGHEAQLRDRSEGGLGLLLGSSVRVGSILDFQLVAELGKEKNYLVEVRHCRPAEGGWRVGCRFAGLKQTHY